MIRSKGFWIGLIVLVGMGIVYFAWALNWNYADGDRAGWIQKLSKKGWVCKTWEGELVLVSLPGSQVEKFTFTVWDDEVAQQLLKVMGKRVTLHYEQKVGLPSSCFGDTRYYVTKVTTVEEIPLAPGVVVPTGPRSAPGPLSIDPAAPPTPTK